jgi:hypothetical protein
MTNKTRSRTLYIPSVRGRRTETRLLPLHFMVYVPVFATTYPGTF